MRSIFFTVKFLELVLIDWRRGDDDNVRVLGSGSRVLDNAFQILLVLIQGDVLVMIWNTCIIGAEENGLLPF